MPLCTTSRKLFTGVQCKTVNIMRMIIALTCSATILTSKNKILTIENHSEISVCAKTCNEFVSCRPWWTMKFPIKLSIKKAPPAKLPSFWKDSGDNGLVNTRSASSLPLDKVNRQYSPTPGDSKVLVKERWFLETVRLLDHSQSYNRASKVGIRHCKCCRCYKIAVLASTRAVRLQCTLSMSAFFCLQRSARP